MPNDFEPIKLKIDDIDKRIKNLDAKSWELNNILLKINNSISGLSKLRRKSKTFKSV